MDRHKRLWRNLVLDVRYQLSFTLPVVLLAAILFAGLGHVAARKAESATKIGIHQIDETGHTYLKDAAKTRDALLRRERAINTGIVIVGLMLCVALALYGVVLSHRVAGPLYRLGVELDKLRDGKLELPDPLRKGDQLIGLYDSFCQACAALRDRERREAEVLRKVISSAEAGGVTEGHLEALRARLRAKEDILG